MNNNTVQDQPELPADAVIVIGRQFGSGGRTIGKLIAGKLGIKYYDTEVFAKAALRIGLHPDIFKEHDEKKPSPLRALMQGAFGIADNFHTVPLNGEQIYEEQSKVIRDLCKKGPCVIVGRTADCILRDNQNLFSVFLHSPLEYRVRNICKRNEATDEIQAREKAIRSDKKRESYYNFYCGEKKWGEASNYHLCIDTSGVEPEEVASLIISAFMYKIKSRKEVCRAL